MAKPSQELIKASQDASKKYGIPASVILAFAGGETSYGTAGMGKSKNNLFGIGNKSYSTVSDSVEDFAKLVTGNKSSSQSKKYGNAIKNAKTTKDYVEAIRNAGYNSENPNYVNLVMGVYKQDNLSQYDSEVDKSKNLHGADTDSDSSSSNTGFITGIVKSITTVAFVVVLIFLAILFLVNAFSSPSQVAEKVKGARK